MILLEICLFILMLPIILIALLIKLIIVIIPILLIVAIIMLIYGIHKCIKEVGSNLIKVPVIVYLEVYVVMIMFQKLWRLKLMPL